MAIDISSIIQKHLTEEATSIEESTVENTTVEETAVEETVVANTSGIQVDFESVVDKTVQFDEDFELFMSDEELSNVRGAIISAAVTSCLTS